MRHLPTVDGVTPTDTITRRDIYLQAKESDVIRQNMFCGRQSKQNVTAVKFCFIVCSYIILSSNSEGPGFESRPSFSVFSH